MSHSGKRADWQQASSESVQDSGVPREVMTILIHFHQSHDRTFKAYYPEHVQVHLTKGFSHLVRDAGCVALIPTMMVLRLGSVQTRSGAYTGMRFIDSTSLDVCTPKRDKSSMGCFYGFKQHLVVNDQGELLACCLTPGNIDD